MHDSTMDMYRHLTRQHWGSDVIIWPETSIPDYQHRITGYLDNLFVEAKNNNTDLLLGLFVKELSSKRYYNSVVHSNGAATEHVQAVINPAHTNSLGAKTK